MGYRSEVGIRCAIKREEIVGVLNQILKNEFWNKDTLTVISDREIKSLEDAEKAVDTFLSIVDKEDNDNIWRSVRDTYHFSFNYEEGADVAVVISAHYDDVKWYDDYDIPTMWRSILHNEDICLAHHFVRIGEDFDDIEEYYDADNYDIEYVNVIRYIDMGDSWQ